jgi:hypothetical protein
MDGSAVFGGVAFGVRRVGMLARLFRMLLRVRGLLATFRMVALPMMFGSVSVALRRILMVLGGLGMCFLWHQPLLVRAVINDGPL